MVLSHSHRNNSGPKTWLASIAVVFLCGLTWGCAEDSRNPDEKSNDSGRTNEEAIDPAQAKQRSLEAISNGNGIIYAGTYNIDHDIHVLDADTLEIRPGARLVFSQEVKVLCDGKLVAHGNTERNIVFSGEAWKGVVLRGSGASGTELHYCTVKNVTGSAVSCEGVQDVDVAFCLFENNKGTFGGAISFSKSSFRVSDSRIVNNSAESTLRKGDYFGTNGKGGGIHCVGSSGTIASNSIIGNSTNENGGGIYAENSSVEISGNCLRKNSCERNGGAIFCNGGDAKINENWIDQNSAEYRGGGIYCTNGEPDIIRNYISHNSTKRLSGISIAVSGGGIACENASPVISDNYICDNSATGEGGGIYCEKDSSPRIEGNLILRNSANDGGGVGCFYQCQPTLNSNCIEENKDKQEPSTGLSARGEATCVESTTASKEAVSSRLETQGVLAIPERHEPSGK